VTTAAIKSCARSRPTRGGAWYALRKPIYLWQFVDIDGAGDVLVYPVRGAPFDSHFLLAVTHVAMRVLHWPLVVLAAVGSIVVWVPSMVRLLPQAGAIVPTIPLNNPVRFAVPVLPAPMAVQTAPSGWNRTSQSTSSQTKPTGRPRRSSPRTAFCEVGNFRLPRLHALLHAIMQMWFVRYRAQDDQEADVEAAAGGQDGVAQTNARPHRQDRGVAESDAQRVSELLRRFRKQPEPVVALQRGAMALDQVAHATQPACIHELGEVHQHNRPLLPVDQDTTPTAMSPLRCQNPRDEPGAPSPCRSTVS
jgi:hypothetical protein